MTKREEYLQDIISRATTPGDSAYKDWAQYPTVKGRALALITGHGQVYHDMNDEAGLKMTLWATNQIHKMFK